MSREAVISDRGAGSRERRSVTDRRLQSSYLLPLASYLLPFVQCKD
ncbi:hypothetical protein [Chroococcidiopsis sp.]